VPLNKEQHILSSSLEHINITVQTTETFSMIIHVRVSAYN